VTFRLENQPMTDRTHAGGMRTKRRMTSAGLLLGLALAAGIVLIGATPGAADLQGSKHDFTGAGWSGGSACAACHVPHRANQPKSPKWGGPTTIRTDPPADRGRPGPLSRSCLNCHDGATARDVFAEEITDLEMPARSRIAAHGDLRRNHPVGVRYPIGDREYQPASRLEAGSRVQLFDGQVECSSCHDVHDTYDLPYMLVIPNDRSQLCTSCHRV